MSDPNVLKRAEVVRAEIERDAERERSAIAAVFDGDGAKTSKPSASTAPAARSPKQP